jgi:hypothetical protein
MSEVGQNRKAQPEQMFSGLLPRADTSLSWIDFGFRWEAWFTTMLPQLYRLKLAHTENPKKNAG